MNKEEIRISRTTPIRIWAISSNRTKILPSPVSRPWMCCAQSLPPDRNLNQRNDDDRRQKEKYRQSDGRKQEPPTDNHAGKCSVWKGHARNSDATTCFSSTTSDSQKIKKGFLKSSHHGRWLFFVAVTRLTMTANERYFKWESLRFPALTGLQIVEFGTDVEWRKFWKQLLGFWKRPRMRN